MKKDSLPFGVKILVGNAKMALSQDGVIKSRVLANMIYLSVANIFPEKIDLINNDYSRYLTDEHKKAVVKQLDLMKSPTYDQTKSLTEMVMLFWNKDKKFEKNLKNKENNKPYKGKTFKKVFNNNKGAVKVNKM